MKPAGRAIKRPPVEPLTGEIHAEPVEGSLSSLYVLRAVSATGRTTFLGLVEGSREEVHVVILKMLLRRRILSDASRRERRHAPTRPACIERRIRRT